MSLEREIQAVDAARRDLAKALRTADGWSDTQREHFDAHRVVPLDKCGAQLRVALVRANDQLRKAARLLDRN